MSSYYSQQALKWVREDFESHVPTKFEVCPQCEGRGHHSQHLGAFTGEDIDRLGDEFFEGYRRGDYDKTCETCNGKNVVEVIDRDRATAAQLHQYDEAIADYEDMAATEAAERRFGA